MEEKIEKFTNMALEYAPKVILAIVVLVIGLWIIKKIVGIMGKALDARNIDKDIRPFLKSLVGVILKVLLIFSVAGMVGIETTSFVAVLAAAGFAVGMALQGSLANFASGVMILTFKPYGVGDLVDVQEKLGHVDEIQIFNTVMTTLDNKKVIIPNAQAISGTITNLSANDFLRVDMNVLLPYEEDFQAAKKVIEDAMKSVPNALSTPAPYCEIEIFDTHNVKLCARNHSTVENYWDVYFNSYSAIKNALSKAGMKVNYAEGMTQGQIGA